LGGDAVEDCAGVCSGDAVEDWCGVCDIDSSNDCSTDCNGNNYYCVSHIAFDNEWTWSDGHGIQDFVDEQEWEWNLSNTCTYFDYCHNNLEAIRYYYYQNDSIYAVRIEWKVSDSDSWIAMNFNKSSNFNDGVTEHNNVTIKGYVLLEDSEYNTSEHCCN